MNEVVNGLTGSQRRRRRRDLSRAASASESKPSKRVPVDSTSCTVKPDSEAAPRFSSVNEPVNGRVRAPGRRRLIQPEQGAVTSGAAVVWFGVNCRFSVYSPVVVPPLVPLPVTGIVDGIAGGRDADVVGIGRRSRVVAWKVNCGSPPC